MSTQPILSDSDGVLTGFYQRASGKSRGSVYVHFIKKRKNAQWSKSAFMREKMISELIFGTIKGNSISRFFLSCTMFQILIRFAYSSQQLYISLFKTDIPSRDFKMDRIFNHYDPSPTFNPHKLDPDLINYLWNSFPRHRSTSGMRMLNNL